MRMKALPILLPLALLGAGAPTISFDEHAVDRSVDPCTDFYQYACNAWIKSNPIPADQPAWGRMNELALRNQNELRDILEKAEKDARDPVQRKIGDYYAACMDERAIEQKGTRPLQDELHRIAALKSKAELPALLAHLHLVSFLAGHPTDSGSHTPLFGFTSGQDLSDASKVVATADHGG